VLKEEEEVEGFAQVLYARLKEMGGKITNLHKKRKFNCHSAAEKFEGKRRVAYSAVQ